MGKFIEKIKRKSFPDGSSKFATIWLHFLNEVVEEMLETMPKFNWGDSISLFKEQQDKFLEEWFES
jgi:hypothetical protein